MGAPGSGFRPRLRLRRSDLEGIYAHAPVATVRVYVADEDWDPFLRVAAEGMEIPVEVEGEPGREESAFLLSVDTATRSIAVVI